MKTAITVIQKLLPDWNDVEYAELHRVSGAMTK